MALEVASLYAKLGLDKSDFDSGLNSARGGIGVLGTAVGVGLGNAATMVGQSVVRAVGDVAGVVTSSIGAAADMEAQLSSIGAVLGKTKDEVQPLSDLIVNLGMNPNLQVNATEAADAIEMLARNGLNMGQILDGAAEATVLLANATGGTFGTAANIATDSMAIFKIEASDMMTAVNGITSVTVGSKFSVDDYGMALAQAGGVAAASGVGFDDFNTAIAGISPLFASGSDAGTSFKTMLQRLIPASDPAAAAMRELGILTEEGSNQFFDANGNLKDMAEISGILQSALGGLSEERRNDALSTIFGTDAMRASVGLMELGKEGFANLQSQMAQTDAMDSAAMRMDNLSGTMEIITGVIDGLKLQVGNALLPTMQMLADKALEFADEVGPKIPAFVDSVAPKIQAFAGWFVNDGVPAIIEFGSKIGEFAAVAGPKIAEFASNAGATIMEWADKLKDGDYSGIISDVQVKLSTAWDTFVAPTLSTFATKFWNWATGPGGAIEGVSGALSAVSLAAQNWLAENWPIIQAALAEWAGKFWDWVTGPDGALSKVGETMNLVTGQISLWAESDQGQGQIQAVGKALAKALISGLQGVFSADTLTTVNNFGQSMMQSIKDLQGAFVDSGISLATGIITGIIEKITGSETSDQINRVIRTAIETAVENINPFEVIRRSIGDAAKAMGIDLPEYATGGIVQGPTGSPQLVMAHGGETIIPTHKQNGGGGQAGNTFNININANDSAGGQRAAYAFVSTLRARGMVTI